MKTTFLLLFVLAGMSLSVTAQRFEHFKVDSTAETWSLSSKVSDSPGSGITSREWDPYIKMLYILRSTVQGFPSGIRQELVGRDVRLYFTFNARGEVYDIVFRGDSREGIPLTDEQWLKVFDTIRSLKPHLPELLTLDYTDHEIRGMYPVSQYLREAVN